MTLRRQTDTNNENLISDITSTSNSEIKSYSNTPINIEYFKWAKLAEEIKELLKKIKISTNNTNNQRNDMEDNILKKIEILEKNNIELQKDVNWLSKVFLPSMFALGGILVTVFVFGFESTKSIMKSNYDSISTEIKSINQRLDYQEKLNSLQIEKDVIQNIEKQKM